MSPDYATFYYFILSVRLCSRFIAGVHDIIRIWGFFNAHESGSNSLEVGTFSRDLTKPCPCSAGILPGLCIWKNQYPHYSPALGGVQMTCAHYSFFLSFYLYWFAHTCKWLVRITASFFLSIFTGSLIHEHYFVQKLGCNCAGYKSLPSWAELAPAKWTQLC